MRKSTVAVIIVIVLLIAAGVLALGSKSNTDNSTPAGNTNNSNNSSSNSNSTNQSAAGRVNIANMAFSPSQITVAKGGTVTWTNNDNTTHTVTDDLSNAGGPNSGDITPGSTYNFTFNKTGSFQYHCSIHPSMRGTIVVK
jgi:plastocyanin